MSSDKSKPTDAKAKPAGPSASAAGAAKGPPPPAQRPPLFRRLDWFVFGVTTLIVFIGYFLTLAPDLTLEDSGELATGSFYAGVPHPPGYPVWTLYSWLFTLIPYSNIAWRVALSSAVAGAFACGLLALMVSRGSSMLIEGIPEFKVIDRRWENVICVVSGFVAGMLLGFNGFMWSQAIIVEVYTLSVLSFMAVLCCLLRWIYAPEQRRYLYWVFFWFGICFTNHQTLIVAAMGIEVAVMAAQPRLGRDLFIGNSLVYILGLIGKAAGYLTAFDNNPPLFLIYNVVGVGSILIVVWLSVQLRINFSQWQAFGRDFLLLIGLSYAGFLFANQAEAITLDKRSKMFLFVHAAGIATILVCGLMTYDAAKDRVRQVYQRFKILFVASAAYLVVSLASSFRLTPFFQTNLAAFMIFHGVGLLLIAASVATLVRRTSLASEIKLITTGAVMWTLGASFYFYMPLASMTNPPMNWGYPRTVEGFKHALTRGQYEQTNPTSSLPDLMAQVGMYAEGAIDEFNAVYLLIGLVPFFFYLKMQKRERAWLVGLVSIGFCLAILLLILLNPKTDSQSRTQARVFFTASHIILAMLIGYGVTVIGGILAGQYQKYRFPLLLSGAIAAAVELYFTIHTFDTTKLALLRYTALLGLGMALLFIAAVLAARERAPLAVCLALFAFIPARTIMSNWAENEQRGHLFGYWFGHDMFTPPFGIYPEMTRNSILFGGTDPGRFNPTYMIFCESFIPPRCKPHDPKFDRRDVSLITQNALADKTYLDYIRAHYNRSTEIDPYFFSELVRSDAAREIGQTNLISRALLPIDRFFTDLGAKIEKRRRAEGVYPPTEINTPSNDDSGQAFRDYLEDAARRLAHDRDFPNEPKQVRPGEGVNFTKDNRVSVSGQIAVMAINALLTKVIFDKNLDREFFVEESFPLDWMFPYLTPFGIIMKINHQALPALSEEVMAKDHEFWSRYSERLIGNWITYDTPVKDICDFAEKTYLRHDFRGLKGDPRFARDEFAQKAFSKLRSAIGNLYSWRLSPECPLEFRPKTPAEQARIMKEADFALRQSYAFCPKSPEALYKYVTLLMSAGRLEDARQIAETSLKFDPSNPIFVNYAEQIRRISGINGTQSQLNQLQSQFAQLEQQFRAAPSNFVLGFQLVSAYIQIQRNDAAATLLEEIRSSPYVDIQTIINVANSYAQMGRRDAFDKTLKKLEDLVEPTRQQYQANTNNAQLGFHLASAYLVLQQTNLALELVDELVARPQADASTLFSAATVYNQMQNPAKLEPTLLRLVALAPTQPETWYDLAAVEAILGKTPQAISSLQNSIRLSQSRLVAQPGSRDLRAEAATDIRFAALRQLPEVQQLLKAR